MIHGAQLTEISIGYYQSVYKTGEQYEQGYCLMDDDYYNKVVNYFAHHLLIPDKPYGIVFYFDSFFSDADSLDISDITAISWYYLIKDGNQLHHRLFVDRNGTFTEIKEFDIDVSYLTVNQSSFQLLMVIKNDSIDAKDKKSYLTLFPQSESFKQVKHGRSEFERVSKKFLGKISTR